MSDDSDRPMMRRTFLRLVGGCAVLPAAGLVACSGDKPPAAEVAPPAPASGDFFSQSPGAPAAPAAGEPGEEEATGEPSAVRAGERLDEQDPLAIALGYRHDANTVDADSHPRWQEGQRCAGCSWFAGAEDTEWAACGLLSGALVSSGGWCNGFEERPGEA